MDILETAFALMDQGENEQALSLLTEKLTLCPQGSDGHLALLNALGYVYCNLTDYPKALDACDAYIDLSQKNADPEQEGIGYHQKAMVLRLMGQYSEAMQYIAREREIYDRCWPADDLKLAVNEYEQGYLLYRMGQLDAGLSHMASSLDHALKTDDLIARGCACRGLGEICNASHQTEQADHYFDKAADFFLKAGDQIGAREIEQLRRGL